MTDDTCDLEIKQMLAHILRMSMVLHIVQKVVEGLPLNLREHTPRRGSEPRVGAAPRQPPGSLPGSLEAACGRSSRRAVDLLVWDRGDLGDLAVPDGDLELLVDGEDGGVGGVDEA